MLLCRAATRRSACTHARLPGLLPRRPCGLQPFASPRPTTVCCFLQEVESERVRGHIATMARRLTKALAVINPAPPGEPRLLGWRRWDGVIIVERVQGSAMQRQPCQGAACSSCALPCPAHPTRPAPRRRRAAADKEERRARLVALALETAGKENQRMLARKVGGACVCCGAQRSQIFVFAGQPLRLKF